VPRLAPSRRGYGRQHERWRRMVLNRKPYCVGWPYNWHRGAPVEATVADHVIPLRYWDAKPELARIMLARALAKRQGYAERDVELAAWSLDNGQGLCAQCHGRKSILERTLYPP